MNIHKIFIFTILYLISLTIYAEKNNSFSLVSDSFQNQKNLSAEYTCDGKNISPSLSWTHPPEKTQTFAILLSDPDAPGGVFYHWVLYNIPKSTTHLSSGASIPSGTIAGKNSWGKRQYNGPCPPKESIHHYVFALYALDTHLNLPADTDGNNLIHSMQNHIIGKGAFLYTTYSH